MNRCLSSLAISTALFGSLAGCSEDEGADAASSSGGAIGTNGTVGSGSGVGSGAAAGTSTSSGGGASGVDGTGSGAASSGGSASGAGGTSTYVASTSNCGSVKWACWPMPTLGSTSGAHSTADYTDNGDGTITDNVTGLLWQQALLPNVYSGTATYAGAWDDAIAACNAIGDGWRLPTRIELTSLINPAKSPPVLDAVFSNVQTATYTYTSSAWWVSLYSASKPQYTWIFALNNGVYSGFTSNAGARTDLNNVRCVKSPHTGEGPYDVAVAPANHYAVNNGEVMDNYTGLIWQQGLSPSKLSWADAKTYCSSLNLNGNTWRLPALQELSSLVDEGTVAPAIDATAFPDTPSGNGGTILSVADKTVDEEGRDWFWTSEPVRGSSTLAWGLNFLDGFTAVQDTTTVLKQNSDGTYSIRYNFWTTGWAKCVR